MTAKERLQALLLDLIERFTSRSFLLVLFEAFVVFSPRFGVNFSDFEVKALTAVVVVFIGGNTAVKVANNIYAGAMAKFGNTPVSAVRAGAVEESTVFTPPSRL